MLNESFNLVEKLSEKEVEIIALNKQLNSAFELIEQLKNENEYLKSISNSSNINQNRQINTITSNEFSSQNLQNFEVILSNYQQLLLDYREENIKLAKKNEELINLLNKTKSKKYEKQDNNQVEQKTKEHSKNQNLKVNIFNFFF